ncbi:MAG: hypothetical protein ACOYL6_04105 [Bacteriovoracaceae bacterium]
MVKHCLSTAIFGLTLSLLTQPLFAQTNGWGGFKDILGTKTVSSGSSSSSTTTVSSSSSHSSTSVSQTGSCSITKENQSTLPLSILKKLGGDVENFFNIQTVPGSNKVEIVSTKMISDCNDMLELGVDKSTSEPMRYFIKVSVKGSKKVSDFVKCINEKAMKDDKPSPDASIGTLSADFAFEKSGEIVFLSEGPMAGAEATEIKGCDYIEPIAKDKVELLTVADRTKRDREGRVSDICKSAGSYRDISDEVITKYQEYKAILENIRNELLIDEVKKLSKSIQVGDDISGLDFSIISDYKKYIIDPLMEEVKLAYEEFQGAQGDTRKALEKKYKALKAKLGAFGKSPYLTESDFNKLKAKGQFDAADELFVIRSSIRNYNKIGTIEDGTRVITPAIANAKIKIDLNDNRLVMKEERLKYSVKTGEVTGKAAQYANISNRLSKHIEAVQKDYDNKSQQVVQQAYRKCPRKFTPQAQQECMTGYANALKRMQRQLTTSNDRDRLLANKFAARATEYAGYEKTGKEYRKSQDGELYEDDSESSDEDIIISDTEISMPLDFSMPENNQSQGNNQSVFNNFQNGQNNLNFMPPQFTNNGNMQNRGVSNYPGSNPFYLGSNWGGTNNNYPYNTYNNFSGGGNGFNNGFGNNSFGGTGNGGFNFGSGFGGNNGFNNGGFNNGGSNGMFR